MIILHCSATRINKRYTADDCKRDHLKRPGFKDIGYHFYIEQDGTVKTGRPIEKEGAHCKNHNHHSIGICLEGGLDEHGQTADTRTGGQVIALMDLLSQLKEQFPHALIVGHHELNPDKECPCFDVGEYRELFP